MTERPDPPEASTPPASGTPAPPQPSELPELSLPRGLLGFPQATRFVLVEWQDPTLGLFLLRSLDDSSLEFLAAAPAYYFPDYAPELDDDAAARLELSAPEDALLLVILTVPDRVEDSTANLLAPVIVNRHTRVGEQVVLDPARYAVKEPVRAA